MLLERKAFKVSLKRQALKFSNVITLSVGTWGEGGILHHGYNFTSALEAENASVVEKSFSPFLICNKIG